MNILIVGRGSIALKHKNNIESFGHKTTLLHDVTSNKNDNILFEYKNLLSSYDAVVIANASHKHFEYANEALKKNKKIYLEKPPCLKTNELNQLICLDNKSSNLVALGFQLRFSNGLNKLKEIIQKEQNAVISFNVHVGQSLKYWREGGIQKDRYYGDRKTGGGALYELSHEIDLAMWLFGNPRKFVYLAKNLLHKDMNIDDYFHSIWEFNKFTGVVHMDMVDPVYSRYVEVIFTDYKLVWNINNDAVTKKDNDGIEVIYSNEHFKRRDLIYLSINNFLKWVAGEEIWHGACLEDSINLINFFEDVENGT